MTVCIRRPSERRMSPAGVRVNLLSATEKNFLLPLAQLDIALKVITVDARTGLNNRIGRDLRYRDDKDRKSNGKLQHFSAG